MRTYKKPYPQNKPQKKFETGLKKLDQIRNGVLMMTREQVMAEFNRLDGMIPKGFGWTPDERQKKIGMRMADLFNYACGNTATIDETWELPEEDG